MRRRLKFDNPVAAIGQQIAGIGTEWKIAGRLNIPFDYKLNECFVRWENARNNASNFKPPGCVSVMFSDLDARPGNNPPG